MRHFQCTANPLNPAPDFIGISLTLNLSGRLWQLRALVNVYLFLEFAINVRSNPLNPKTIAVDVPVLKAAGVDVNHSYQ